MLFCLTVINFAAGHACADAAQPTPTKLPNPLTFIGQYSFSWGAISLGRLEISIEEKPESYQMKLAVTSAGLVNLFTRHESDTTVSGIRSLTRYQPLHYESHYKTKQKPRHIRITFNARGTVTEELNDPPENRALRPEVPAKLKNGSYDPLTSLMLIRNGMPTLPVFDAKRLYQAKVEESGEEILPVLGTLTPARHYTLARTPLAGMTDKETREYAQGEPPLHIYISKDARRIPVYLSMPIFMGSIKGVLSKECKTWDECKVK